MAQIIKDLKIYKIGYGGVGIGSLKDGKKVIIKGWALPNTMVDCRVVKQKKDYVEAHIIHINEYDKTMLDGEIFCPHFFSPLETEDQNTKNHNPKIGCWWCKRQVISYPKQLELKESIVRDSFLKTKKIFPDLGILPIIWSPLTQGYRNKIEFSFWKYITSKISETPCRDVSSKRLQGETITLSDRSLGFHKQGEFSKIVDIDHCGLMSEKANAAAKHIKSLCFASWLPVYDQKTHQGFFRHLVIREASNTGQLMINLSMAPKNLTPAQQKTREKLLETFKKDEIIKKEVTSFFLTHNNGVADTVWNPESKTDILLGEKYIFEKLIFDETDVTFRVSPTSFFQTNTHGAELLFQTAKKMTGYIKGNILDLYCGTGSIGISFLKTGTGEKLIGIEIVAEAITDARENAKINGIQDDCLFFAGAAERILLQEKSLEKKLKDTQLVIVDPPREGLHKNVIAFLWTLKKIYDFKLLYISCNPITMARDIELFAAEWFSIKEIQPVDMFPHTHHIECIGVLQ